MDNLLLGFGVALEPINLLFVVLGALLGTIIGLLPGLGPTATIALLLPVTYTMEPTTAIIFLAGIFYGSMFGGRIPAILLNVPGDGAAVVTTLDGYPLKQQGRAGVALSITAVGSFIGGLVALLGIVAFIPYLSRFALGFGPPELFLLAFLGLMLIALLASGTMSRGLLSAALGIFIAMIGFDSITGTPRFTLGEANLLDGISIVPLAVGLFGISEVMMQAEQRFRGVSVSVLGNIWPKLSEITALKGAITRSSIIGFFLGLMPGGGGAMASVVGYGVEKRFSKHPEKFGHGAMDGLAATETADNAGANSSFVPLLTLGIPPNPVIALIGSALILQGITPGPDLVQSNPDVFWGLIASMFIGLVVLFVLNLPLIGLFVQILRVPPLPLAGTILALAIAGTFSIRSSLFDVFLLVLFGLVGYALRRCGVPLGPLVIGFILAPIMESELRRSLILSGGEFSIFLDRPISAGILILAGTLTVITLTRAAYSRLRRRERVEV
ncbi:tripartite tricarboxylate transporter permease [Aeromicrobium sp. CTD01-1L150]|uniref:tripartite tricarboxylate transporter permease n=1 Tax=Aeromicrobium sp. CTD01-1L150 TaxID=3341830 RepID=UPI0035BF30A0